jgi:hypothetical protein
LDKEEVGISSSLALRVEPSSVDAAVSSDGHEFGLGKETDGNNSHTAGKMDRISTDGIINLHG